MRQRIRPGSSSVLLLVVVAAWFTAPSALARQQAEEPPAPVIDAPSGPPRETTSDYIIGPGDSIQVFVWRNPELSISVPVRPEGKVSTPLIEGMVAVGKKPSELARDIEARLAEYIADSG